MSCLFAHVTSLSAKHQWRVAERNEPEQGETSHGLAQAICHHVLWEDDHASCQHNVAHACAGKHPHAALAMHAVRPTALFGHLIKCQRTSAGPQKPNGAAQKSAAPRHWCQALRWRPPCLHSAIGLRIFRLRQKRLICAGDSRAALRLVSDSSLTLKPKPLAASWLAQAGKQQSSTPTVRAQWPAHAML